MGQVASFRRQTPGVDRFAALCLACAAAATFTAGLRKELDRPARVDTAQVVVMPLRADAPRRWTALDSAPEPMAEPAPIPAAVARVARAEQAALNPAPALQIATADTAAVPAVAVVDAAVVPELPDTAALRPVPVTP
jgi:hypothetical protein